MPAARGTRPADPGAGLPRCAGGSGRGPQAPDRAGGVLARVVGRARGPARAVLPAPERLLHAVGRPERREHVPPRARRPAVALPHPRADALVRGLHPRDPRQLHAPGGPGARSSSSPRTNVGIHEGDEFEILLGGRRRTNRTTSAPRRSALCSIREYYFDWQPLEPATLTIECLDADGPPARVTAEQLVAQLEEAAPHGRPTRCRTGTST